MAKYSDKDLHWITVHPNGKEEKPGVKVALNGAGKVVKGPKGLKEDINAEGGLPGAKSLPLEELKKQKGHGGVGGAGGGAGAGQGENAFSGLTDALGGLLDDGEGAGEVGVAAPADAASSLLDDEAGTAGGGEKPSGSKMCENAQKFFASFKAFHQQYLNKAGSQEILEEAVASALTDDDFKAVNGKTLIKSDSLGKLTDAIEAAKEAAAKKSGAGAPAAGGENPSLFTDKKIDDFVKNHYGSYGYYGSDEDQQLLKEVIAEHPEWFKINLWNGGGLEYSSLEDQNKAFGLVDEKKLALEQAKKGEGGASGDSPLCPKAKKWLAQLKSWDYMSGYVKIFGSEDAFKQALAEFSDEDFLENIDGEIFFSQEAYVKFQKVKNAAKAKQTATEKPQLGLEATKFIDEKGYDYKWAISTIQKKFGCSESEAEKKLAGYLAEMGEDGIYETVNIGDKYVFGFSPKGEKALEAAIERDAASNALQHEHDAKSKNADPNLLPQAQKWLESPDAQDTWLLYFKNNGGMSDEEAQQKLKELAATLGEEDVDESGKLGPNITTKLLEFADKKIEQYKAWKLVEKPWAEQYLNNLKKAGFTEDEAKEKLKEIFGRFGKSDYNHSMDLPTIGGVEKIINAVNAAVAEKKGAGGAQQEAAAPSATSQASLSETWAKSDYAKEHYLPEVTDALGLEGPAAEAKLAEIAATLGSEDFTKDGDITWSGGEKIMDAINKEKAEKSAAASGGVPDGECVFPFTDKQVDNFVKTHESVFGAYGSDEDQQLLKEVIAEHPEWFKVDGSTDTLDYFNIGSINKVFGAIEDKKLALEQAKGVAAAKVKELVKKNKLCKKAAEFLVDGNGLYSNEKELAISTIKQMFGIDDDAAEKKLAQALTALNGKNFTEYGDPTSLGWKKLKESIFCKQAKYWLDEKIQPSLHDFFLGKLKSSLNIQDDEEAKKKMALVLSGLKDADFDNNGELTDGGFKQVEKEMKKLAKQQTEPTHVSAPISAPAAQSAQAAKPLPPPTPAKTVSPELTAGNVPFPKDEKALSGLTMVKELGGGSGAHATLYKDADGNMFVMKKYAATDKAGQARLKEECDADAFYLSGGANVPHFRLYGDEKSGYTKLSQYIPGTKTLGEVWQTADKATREKITQNLRKDFALDVMAGAWDVLGKGRDNILVDGEGNVWRCDNGGAFNRRAQGGEKDEASWASGHIDDLWTMRGMSAGLDGKKVPDGTGKAEFFGGITTHQLLSDIVTRDWDKMTAHLPEATRQVMAKRIANAKEYHAVCDNVVVDGMYGDGQHSEDITLNYHCLNKFGARAGCVNKNVGPGNWGFCRGNGNGKPAPKLEDFTKAPEPTLAQFMPSPNKGEAAAKLLAAGKTINHHLFDKKDGPVNKQSVDAALALKPSLEAVANEGGKDAAKAKEMLAFLDEVQKVKDGGYKELGQKFGFAPSGEVDLNTAAAKAEAQAKFAEAHKEWQETTKNAQAKYAAAKKKWEKENGGNAFKWKNLTDCFEDFCKQNGIESSRFWDMARGQGGSSQGKGSSRMKVLEILSMGGNLDHPYTSVKGVSDHTVELKEAADEYKTHPDWLARDLKAYIAMKSLTQMILHNSSFVGNFPNGRFVRMCRTESFDDVIDKYDVQKGVPTIYNMGTHESFSVFETFCFKGHEAVICDVPYSRISSLYFLRSPNPIHPDMYLGDDENEGGVNAIGIPNVYWKHVPKGVSLPITEAWAFYEAAMKNPVVYAKNKNKATSV